MHRLNRGAQLAALVLLLMLGGSNVGCEKKSSSAGESVGCQEDGPGMSTSVIDASGGDGNSTDGTGGRGGFADFLIYRGGAGHIEVKSSGSVDASFTPTTPFTFATGANPLSMLADLSIPVVTSAPALDVPYMLELDSNLYVSDGDMDLGDETPVTGLWVEAGATLTLGLNGIEGANLPTGGLAFSDDVINFGTITVVDVDDEQRGSIDIFAAGNYIGTGRIETFGTTPGQDGGDLTVSALGNAYNSGDWGSSGAGQTDGRAGNAGTIYFFTGEFDYATDDDGTPGGLIENTGNMTANGGAASGASGFGGHGGGILIVPYLSVWNSGDLDANGGDGIAGGGDGGYIEVAAYNRGDLRNTGDLTADGGDAELYAGGGGEIGLAAWGGELRSSGVMLSRGGDALSESLGETGDEHGGYGGYIGFYTASSIDDYEESELDVPAGDIMVSGEAIATGGDALGADGSAGGGGWIDFSIQNDISEGTQSICVFGVDGVHARSGDGGLEGGSAETIPYFGLLAAIALDLAVYGGTATGSVIVEPPMNSSGGNADPGVMGSTGGDAGDIEINAGTISYGVATADGGMGETPGADGTITPETVTP